MLEDSAGRLVGLEVKATATLGRADGRGLKALAEAVGQRWIRGAILYTGTEVIPFGSNLDGLPLPLRGRHTNRIASDAVRSGGN